jgi:PAS domain S-box-containing protein
MNSHEIFTLLLNLSRMNNRDEILQFFIKRMTELFDCSFEFFSEEPNHSQFRIYPVSTPDSVFGYIKTGASVSSQDEPLIHSSIEMLSNILEKHWLHDNLKNQRQAFTGLVHERMEELFASVKELEIARQDALNLINDLSAEIEKRVETENSLRISEEKYRRITENINDVVWTTDLNFRTTYISPSIFNQTGKTPEEHYRQSLEEKFTPESLQRINAEMQEELENEKDPSSDPQRSRIIEVQYYKADGSKLWVSMNMSFLRDSSGKIIGLQGITRDINHRKLTEIALQESEEKYRLLFNNTMQGFALHEIILDDDGIPVDSRLLDANPAFEALTGLKVESIIGKKSSEIVPGSEKCWMEVFGKVALTGQPIRYENYLAPLQKYFDTWIFSPRKRQFAVMFSDVTQSQNARNTLIESEQKYRTLFETNKDGIIIFRLNPDYSFQILERNQALRDILGYTNDNEYINALSLEVDLTPELVESRLNKIKEMGMIEFQSILYHADGRRVDVHNSAIGITYMGQPAIYNIIRDITVQKQMERLMEARFRLMEYAENYNLPSLLRKALSIAESLTGSAMSYYHFVDEGSQSIVASHWSENTLTSHCRVTDAAKALENDSLWKECLQNRNTVVYNNIKNSDTTRTMVVPVFRNSRIVAVLGIGNKPGLYTSSDIDVTRQLADLAWDIAERKQARQKLQESEAKYRLIFENSPLGVLQFDKEGIIKECNDQFVNIIGSSKEVLIGLDMTRLPDQRIQYAVREVLNGKASSFTGTYNSVTANKSTPVRLLFSPVIGSDGKIQGGIGLVEDRTSIIQQEAFKKQVALANESIKFKQNFLANMSHEIRTPLTGIMGIIELMTLTGLTPIQQEYLNTLRSSSDNLKEIINQVLDFSKIEAGKVSLKLQPFEFKILLDNAYRLFKGTCEKDVEFTINLDPNIPRSILADKNRLTQIVNNLISNAVKFTQKGNITLSANLVYETDDHLVMKIEIKDTGVGMLPELQNKLFTPFMQIEDNDTRKYEGTGLGLSICKQLVKLHGGDIGMESQYKKGSKFWFTFKAQRSNLEIPEPRSRSHSSSTGKLKILFAEDKEVTRKVVNLMLSSMGHEVSLVSNGHQAVDAFSPGKYDLILMDIQMPVMDGITATQLLRSKHNILPPIVGVSANAFEGDKEKYMSLGMDDYITKPVRSEDFKELLGRLF